MPTTPATQSALAWLRAHAPVPADAHEAVALAVHAFLLFHDFRPAATPPPDTVAPAAVAAAPNTAAAPTAAAPAPDADADADVDVTAPATLPPGWGGAGYGGQYRHVRSSMLFDIRAVRMGGRLVVHAAAGEDDTRMHTIDIRVADFLRPEPGTHDNNRNTDDADEATGLAESNWHDVVRMDDLATLVAVQIAHRLVPDGAKHGYEDTAAASSSSSAAPPSAAGQQPRQPYRAPPLVPPPGWPRAEHDVDNDNDPLRIGPVRRPPPRMPLDPMRPGGLSPFGHDDLHPPGMPGMPGMGGGLGPRPQAGGMFGPGGNLMGPGQFHPGGGGGRLPPGVPPGARYDPIGPGPDPDMEPLPGFDDEHGIGGQQPYGRMGGRGRGGRGMGGPRFGPGPGRGAGGFGDDDGPPPGMFF